MCLIYIIEPDTILNIQMSGNADILPGLRAPGVSRRTFDWVAKNEGLDECVYSSSGPHFPQMSHDSDIHPGNIVGGCDQ